MDGKKGVEVLRLLSQLRCEHLQPTVVTFGSLAACLGGHWRDALRLLTEAVSSKLRPSSPLRNSVLNAQSQGHRWQAALDAMQTGVQVSSAPNTITFNTVMTGQDWKEASELLGAMRRRCVQQSIASYGTALESEELAWKNSLPLLEQLQQDALKVNLIICTSLMQVLPWEQVSQLLHAMDDWTLERNVMIVGASLTSTRSWENVQEVLVSTLHRGIQPDAVCWEALMLAQGQGRRWELAQSLVVPAAQDLRVRSANVLATIYNWGDQWTRTLQVFHSMKQRDVVSFNLALGACHRSSDVVELLASMREKQLRLDAVGANAALSSFATIALWREPLKLVELMRNGGIPRELATSSGITNACQRAGQWQRALTAVRLEDALIDPKVLAVAITAAEGLGSIASQDLLDELQMLSQGLLTGTWKRAW